MLTRKKTPFLIANVVEKNKITDRIYYDDSKLITKDAKLNQCPHCFRQFGRKDLFRRHLVVCRTKIEQLLKLYEENPSHFRKFELDRETDEKLELAFPLANKERLCMMISGQNGCGKSTFIRLLLINYLMVYNDRDIYLFSSQEYDDKLDVFPNINRISLDESFLEEEIKLDD